MDASKSQQRPRKSKKDGKVKRAPKPFLTPLLTAIQNQTARQTFRYLLRLSILRKKFSIWNMQELPFLFAFYFYFCNLLRKYSSKE